jgi:hypothetical protein
MVKLRTLLALSMAAALAGSALAASVARRSDSGPAAKASVASDHIPEFDGPMTTVAGSDGRTWAAWAFRAAHEFDVAVSSLDQSATAWSPPVFFGRRNGSDDVDPVLAVDSRGSVYLAFAATNPPRVLVATLAMGSTIWSEPVIVSGPEPASSPALLLVGDRLVVAYRTAQGVAMVAPPTIGGANQINGIQDSPEGVDPLGVKSEPVRSNGPLPASSSTPLP